MGALPKRKISKGRRNRRRANNALAIPAFGPCPNCSASKRAHFECANCGHTGAASAESKSKEK